MPQAAADQHSAFWTVARLGPTDQGPGAMRGARYFV